MGPKVELPITFERTSRRPCDLWLGFHGDHVDFDWRPYKDRTPEARADYDRLIVSLFHHGLKQPVIVHGDFVLIGMRRVEILKRLDPWEPIECLDIIEDVSKWTEHDLPRLEALKQVAGSFAY